MVQVSYTFTKELAVKTAMELGKRRLMFRLMPWLGVLNLGFLFIIWTANERVNGIVVLYLFAICYMLFYYRIVKFRVAANFQKSPSANKTIYCEFTEAGIHQSMDGTDIKADWESIYQVRECADGYLIYPGPKLGVWVPKEAFSSESDEQLFRTYAGGKLVARS